MASGERRWRASFRVLGIATFCLASASTVDPVRPRVLDLAPPHDPATLIVGVRRDYENLDAFIKRLQESPPLLDVVDLDPLGLIIVRVKEGGDDALQSAAAGIGSSEAVSFVQPSYQVFADHDWEESDSEETDQWALERIEAEAAWGAISSPTPVVVAVLDTGMATDHPDLTSSLWHNPCEACANGSDDSCSDGRKNGRVDDSHGWNFLDMNNDLSGVTEHGTTVAGVIGAVRDNEACIDGVSPWAELMTLKAMPKGAEAVSEAQVIAAVRYAILEGARVLNFSWSLGKASAAMGQAFRDLAAHEILVVAAAGASAFPCGDGFSNVICVGATDEDNEPRGDNWDNKTIHLGAPGVSIRTTWPMVAGIDCTLRSGASMAAPHVSGVAALVLAKCPDASLDELMQRIVRCTRPVGSLESITISGGLLNARHALEGACGAAPSDCNQPHQANGSTPR